MDWAIGVDVGGTFTDLYLHNTKTGAFHIGKTPSTPHDPAEAIVTGLLDICKANSVSLKQINSKKVLKFIKLRSNLVQSFKVYKT